MKIELNKKYRYRDGEPARVLCVDGPRSLYPVVSMRQDGGIVTHTIIGEEIDSSETSIYDLIEVREPLECWVRVRADGTVDFSTPPDSHKSGPLRRLFREVIE